MGVCPFPNKQVVLHNGGNDAVMSSLGLLRYAFLKPGDYRSLQEGFNLLLLPTLPRWSSQTLGINQGEVSRHKKLADDDERRQRRRINAVEWAWHGLDKLAVEDFTY